VIGSDQVVCEIFPKGTRNANRTAPRSLFVGG